MRERRRFKGVDVSAKSRHQKQPLKVATQKQPRKKKPLAMNGERRNSVDVIIVC